MVADCARIFNVHRHQNWYVYNHIMYARWLLEDATNSLNAQMLELAPSLLGHVATRQPAVTVTVGDDWVRARAWRDAEFEAQAPGNLCVHVVAVSINDRPGTFSLDIADLCGTPSMCPSSTSDGTSRFVRIFINLTALSSVCVGMHRPKVRSSPTHACHYQMWC